jgi:hypothetical protein
MENWQNLYLQNRKLQADNNLCLISRKLWFILSCSDSYIIGKMGLRKLNPNKFEFFSSLRFRHTQTKVILEGIKSMTKKEEQSQNTTMMRWCSFIKQTTCFGPCTGTSLGLNLRRWGVYTVYVYSPKSGSYRVNEISFFCVIHVCKTNN